MKELNEEPAFTIGLQDPTFDLPPRHNKLMAEQRALASRLLRPERRDD
jgi:hypothetical protein